MSTSIKSCSITQWETQWITESGTHLNSTVLITFILLLILLYKKKCFVYFPRSCPLYSLSVNVQCYCLCVDTLILTVCCISLFCYYVFFIWSLNCWIVKLNTHTHWTVNYGGIFWFDHTLPSESDCEMRLKHSKSVFIRCTKHWRFILTLKSSV